MALTNIEAKNAKPREKPYKLADAKGLYLQVQPNGSKYWRMKYRFQGKEKVLAFGVFPEVSLREAREKQDDARRMLRDDIDPGAVKRSRKMATREAESDTFAAIAKEWILKEQ
ncbi:MAG: Arm DNA-binding domain-containing protein, partial [Gammaproteobacteria bacterium]|nr:Arm DNA-binding domain-containing protein [Gammaproteobacteria bacterium]